MPGGEVVTKTISPTEGTSILQRDGAGDIRMTRKTLHELSSGTLYFKLGQEGTYKSYINHFSSMAAALSKQQANELRTKQTHMSHKFSLTDVTAFKWVGSLHGNRTLLVNTVRQTMLQLEGNLPSMFMHPNWSTLRKTWIHAVSNSTTPTDFGRALTVLQCCMKRCIMLNVWTEALGHTQLKKITNMMKEEKKRNEKRERREREDEEERLRPYIGFIKYTLGLKHQVAKQKGEEYRLHGQNGWLWLSGTRNYSPQDSSRMGLRNGPHRLAVKYSDTRDGSNKVVLMEPKAFAYLCTKQEEIDRKKKNGEETTEDEVEKKQEVAEESENASKDKQANEKKRLEEALKNARLERQAIPEEALKDVVDVCAGLANPTRVVYPKVAKKARVIDDFLQRRLQLKTLEERRIDLKLGKETSSSSALAKNSTNSSSTSSSATNAENDKVKITPANEESDVDVEGISESKTSITSDLANDADEDKSNDKEEPAKKVETFVHQAKKVVWAMVSKLKDKALKQEEAKDKKEEKPTLSRGDECDVVCYSTYCRSDLKDSIASCYSPTCKKLDKVIKMEVDPSPNSEEDEVSPTIVGDAARLYAKVTHQGRANGLDLPKVEDDLSFMSIEDAILKLQDLVRILMTKKEQFDRESAMGMSTVTTTTSTSVTTKTTETVTTVNGDIDSVTRTKSEVVTETKAIESDSKVSEESKTTEVSNETSVSKSKGEEVEKSTVTETSTKTEKEANIVRVYSSQDTTARLYLKRIQSVADTKKQSKVIKYPLAPNFLSRTRKIRNILYLAKHNVKHLARKAGQGFAEGFNHNAKTNNAVWPYPCSRPVFRTTWLFRTSSVTSLQAVALQLRILWCSIRWDDMATRPLSIDGKHQTTTDSAISTTEILRVRHIGRFLHRTQYLKRTVTIPLDVPKSSDRDFTPIRSGLRKRKREEAPQQTEPKVTEDWIDEDKLELWEIRGYKERLERDRNMSVTRSRTGTQIREPIRLDPSADLKARMEDQASRYPAAKKPPIYSPLNSQNTNAAPTILRRITNPDGSVSLVRTMTPQQALAPTVVNQTQGGMTKKLFVTKDGKIIGSQLVPQQTPTVNKVAIPATPTLAGAQAVSVQQQQQQKVQIVRSSDGKIQVRGLLPGQQLVQMPDGKLQIFTNPNATATTNSATTTAVPSPTVINSTPTGNKLVALQPPGGGQQQQIILSPSVKPGASPQTIQLAGTPTTPAAAATSKPIIAQELAPGSPIPPGMSAFISGGKTFCIPKATTTMAKQATATTTTPATSLVAASPTVQGATASPVTPASVGPGKQMVEVKSLGQNTVTYRNGQMIVSGPDVTQAQEIAKQLASGQARLATLGGKQVLVSTTNPTPGSTVAKAAPSTPTPALPTQPVPPDQATQQEPKPAEGKVQVTAQLLQTAQGPRIVLQGIQGSNLPKEDLAVIQQQVKHQLLKAQTEAKQQGKVPPTKIDIDLPDSIQSKLQPQAKTAEPAVNTPEPAKPVVAVPPPETMALPTNPVPIPVANATGAVAQPRMIVVNQMGQQKIVNVTPNAPSSIIANAKASPTSATPNKDGKFEVTKDYIQNAISNALDAKNLSPEIQQKLLALQQRNKGRGLEDPDTKLTPGDKDWKPPSAYRKRKSGETNDLLVSDSSSSPIPPMQPLTEQNDISPTSSQKAQRAPSRRADEKKRQQIQTHLQAMLFKEKESLKKEIAKKRSLQEKEVQEDIFEELQEICPAAVEVDNKAETEQDVDIDVNNVEAMSSSSLSPTSTAAKRKRAESGQDAAEPEMTSPRPTRNRCR